ncbi:hypothetical protein [Stackebrandtia nassauensis]|uniref:Tat pathway signal sequence domain protein n=1 Tax=Stackebrandtia nassauensis (strain DSM 44728 / CIP 108903 / NRRL B-16338 / NBRC 102104 / LLR-40K-21) TaxID=446470 RepID=D3PZG2_STANL|nr:hypothetical protein [Stackebrandtia nassauensis]ADD41636.1 hypothetical protein Snas_1940 [Stackebrandtia nassauensis DSM 44728]
MSASISRRSLLAATGVTVAAAGLAYTTAEASTVGKAEWQERWAPDPGSDGLDAFEGVEDDRADSHPDGQPHIYVEDDAYRFNMHMEDVDSHTDRQRQEVKGMRTPAGGDFLVIEPGSTWRLNYQVFIPETLLATKTFTHITQLYSPKIGPAMMISLRRVDGVETMELKDHPQDILVERTELAPLKERWIDIELEILAGDAPDGAVRWVVKDGSQTIVDVSKDGLGTSLEGVRIRPKWGIYRSLEDDTGSLRDCHLLMRGMRAYEQV